MLPFTRTQFFAEFAEYNLSVHPAAVVAYAAAGAAIATIIGAPPALAWRVVSLVIAIMWTWTGIAYHWMHFAAINPAARGFAAVFVAHGAIAAWLALARAPPAHPPDRAALAAGWVLVAYAAVIYPLLGSALGHSWPAAPAFGITPCPLAIFTFGALLLTPVAVPWPALAVPFLWSLVGGSAAVLLDVAPDWMLPVAGVVGGHLLLRRRYLARSAPG